VGSNPTPTALTSGFAVPEEMSVRDGAATGPHGGRIPRSLSGSFPPGPLGDGFCPIDQSPRRNGPVRPPSCCSRGMLGFTIDSLTGLSCLTRVDGSTRGSASAFRATTRSHRPLLRWSCPTARRGFFPRTQQREGKVARKRYDVAPDGGEWKVETGGTTVRLYDTKEPAIDEAVRRAKAHEGDAQVVIRRKDGTIQDERTYGHDPYPPKG
jgi:hypothetical protein